MGSHRISWLESEQILLKSGTFQYKKEEHHFPCNTLLQSLQIIIIQKNSIHELKLKIEHATKYLNAKEQILLGHWALSKQFFCRDVFPSHVPPCSSTCTFFLVSTRMPGPHDLLHVPSFQSPQTQLTRNLNKD